MKVLPAVVAACAIAMTACSAQGQRGIADERSHFEKFLPMKQDPARDGLKAVRPYFDRANRAQILGVIEHVCQGRKEGSSAYDPRSQRGYYVNCNPHNRQFLNGYIPLNTRKRPRSEP
jgi:hypothetical protein